MKQKMKSFAKKNTLTSMIAIPHENVEIYYRRLITFQTINRIAISKEELVATFTRGIPEKIRGFVGMLEINDMSQALIEATKAERLTKNTDNATTTTDIKDS